MAIAKHLKLQFSEPELFILISCCDLPGWSLNSKCQTYMFSPVDFRHDNNQDNSHYNIIAKREGHVFQH